MARTQAGAFVLLAWLFLGLPSSVRAQGYQVQPMLSEIRPSGAEAMVRLLIANTGAVPITLEMEPFRATVDEAGTPTRAPEERDLLVFPPQAIIQPGKEQSVQVRYVGDPALRDARMYGVRIVQLPVDFAAGAGGQGAAAELKVGFNFLSHIVVAPAGAASELTVGDVARRPDGSVAMKLRNSGNAVVVLNNSVWKLKDGAGHTADIANDKVQIGGFSALMPNQARAAVVPADAVAQLAGPVQVSLERR